MPSGLAGLEQRPVPPSQVPGSWHASSAVQVTGLGTVSQLIGGNYITCALKSTGTLWCWGENQVGQLGDGTTNSPKLSPQQATVIGTGVISARRSIGERLSPYVAACCVMMGLSILWY